MLPMESSRLPERVELIGVPFYSQEEHQGAPAALATMLNQRGLETSPGLLKEQVLKGKNRQEAMMATARRYGMQVQPLTPQLSIVLDEVAAGNPVLVMQELSRNWSWWSKQQFAVVVGYDRRGRTLVLRSGVTRRLVVDFASFERSWAKGGHWAVLIRPAERQPTAQRLR